VLPLQQADVIVGQPSGKRTEDYVRGRFG